MDLQQLLASMQGPQAPFTKSQVDSCDSFDKAKSMGTEAFKLQMFELAIHAYKKAIKL